MNYRRTCRLVTLGCKVNQYETQLVREALEQHGFHEALEEEPADLCVVNTCTVTNNGDSRSRQVIRQLHRQNPGTRIIVMGCYATRDPRAVSQLPGVIEVVTDKRELPDVLSRFGIHDLPAQISGFEGHRRAFIKIQDGCILKCSYCIIPTVRPGLRSRSIQDIETEVRQLVENGYREIVISGIHMGHYGIDRPGVGGKFGTERLWHLLERLDQIPGNWRMRLSSMEAVELSRDFLAVAGQCEHLCPQFHPALQSGSNSVLSRMRRRYRVESFLDRLDEIREVLGDNTAFSTDVITGFPGETDSEFEETLNTCRKAKFMKIHVFPFSRRDGTPAAEMPLQVPADVIRERVQILTQLERELAVDFYQQHLCTEGMVNSESAGTLLEVLVENTKSVRDGYVCGTDRYYMPVEVPGTSDDQGQLVYCRGIRADRNGITAERADSTKAAVCGASQGVSTCQF